MVIAGELMNNLYILSFREEVYLRSQVQVLPPRANQPVTAFCGR